MTKEIPPAAVATPPGVRMVRCPRCRTPSRYDETNENRPFCSARCKNEDIIGWAEEKFKIPDSHLSEEDAELVIKHHEESDD